MKVAAKGHTARGMPGKDDLGQWVHAVLPKPGNERCPHRVPVDGLAMFVGKGNRLLRHETSEGYTVNPRDDGAYHIIEIDTIARKA